MIKNPVLFYSMLNQYLEISISKHFIFGFCYQKNVYEVLTDTAVLPYILKLDKASRGNGYSVRFSPTKAQKVFLLSLGAKLICSESYFNNLVKSSKYNKGEIFEKLIIEKTGEKWQKNSRPFFLISDVKINGTNYQIKFEKATFTNETILSRYFNTPKTFT